MSPIRCVLLSGSRGAGKTTAVVAVARELRLRGVAVSGIACPGVFSAGAKTGIRYLDLDGGNGASLARVDPDLAGLAPPSGRPPRPETDASGNLRYGKWMFSEDAMRRADETGAAGVRAAMGACGRMAAFVDEIGPLELDWQTGFIRSLAALDAAFAGADPMPDGTGPAAAVVVACRDELAAVLSARWPGAVTVSVDAAGVDGAIDQCLATVMADTARPSLP